MIADYTPESTFRMPADADVRQAMAPLEGIAYGKMEGEGVLKRCHVVVAFFAGVIRCVYAYSEVGAYDEHSDVKS